MQRNWLDIKIKTILKVCYFGMLLIVFECPYSNENVPVLVCIGKQSRDNQVIGNIKTDKTKICLITKS